MTALPTNTTTNSSNSNNAELNSVSHRKRVASDGLDVEEDKSLHGQQQQESSRTVSPVSHNKGTRNTPPPPARSSTTMTPRKSRRLAGVTATTNAEMNPSVVPETTVVDHAVSNQQSISTTPELTSDEAVITSPMKKATLASRSPTRSPSPVTVVIESIPPPTALFGAETINALEPESQKNENLYQLKNDKDQDHKRSPTARLTLSSPNGYLPSSQNPSPSSRSPVRNDRVSFPVIKAGQVMSSQSSSPPKVTIDRSAPGSPEQSKDLKRQKIHPHSPVLVKASIDASSAAASSVSNSKANESGGEVEATEEYVFGSSFLKPVSSIHPKPFGSALSSSPSSAVGDGGGSGIFGSAFVSTPAPPFAVALSSSALQQPYTFGSAFTGPSFGSTASQVVQKNVFADMPTAGKSIKPSVDADEEGEDGDEGDHAYAPIDQEDTIKPIIHLEPVAQLITGEEGEETLFSVRAKLFESPLIPPNTGNWRERGVGLVKLNRCPSDGKDRVRLVMRMDGVLKVILNVYVGAGMPVTWRNEKYVEIVAAEAVGSAPTKFLFKLGSADSAERLGNEIRSAAASLSLSS